MYVMNASDHLSHTFKALEKYYLLGPLGRHIYKQVNRLYMTTLGGLKEDLKG